MSRYGTIRTPVDIVSAAVARLSAWHGEYVKVLNAQYGTSLGPLKFVGPIQDLQRFQDNGLPAALIVVTNSTGTPEKDGDGYYSMPYNLIVGCVAVTTSEEDTRRTVALYGAAAKLSLGQQRKLADDVTVQDWTGESIDPMTVREKKRLLVCTNSFTVRLDNVYSWKQGPGPGAVPPGPTDPPLGDWPPIQSEPELTITKEPIT